jgi:hypothetical protein
MAARLGITIKGLPETIDRAREARVLRRPLRRGFRAAAKAVKAAVVRRAGALSRRLARRTSVAVDSSPVPTWARVTNKSPWINVAEVGRHRGAKQPPMGVLRGGFPAARAVARRGLPGHHVMERAAADSRGQVAAIMGATAREVEALWRARR